MFSTMEPLSLSLPGARADRKPSTPPALPIKQRRSQSSSTSSAPDLQVDGSILNLSASSPLASPFIDVFAVTVDCNAPECPIHHQRYGTPGYHQERFFSDQLPPPVPKKRLVRTLSLPANTHCNMIPTPNSVCNVKNSPIEYAGEMKNDVQQFSSFNQLNFDTSDEDLQNLLSLWHQERVCEAIQDFYLRFLKKATSHMEVSVLLKEQEVEMIKALHPQDLMLCENPQPEKKQSVYFLVNFPKVPEVFLSAKVSRRGYVPTCPMSMPCHPNIEDTVAHFPPGMAQETQLSPFLTSAMTSEMSHEGSTEPYHESGITSKEPTVLHFLKTGFTVTIVRDFPWATLEDFVQERISQHCSPDVYERRLCLLMLQLFLGLQHLETHNAKPAELRAGTIMLVWSQIQNRQLTEKERFDENPRVTKEKAKSVHALWEKWGTPRVIISPSNLPADPTSKDVLHSRLQMSSILKFCLHQQMEIHQNTQYTSGLIYLTNQLSCEDSEIQTSDIAGILQTLLWGPRAGLFEKNQANTTVIHNWLMVKRSLLVLKLAGKGLVLNQCGLDWEDPLCLQYFSHTDSDRILRTTAHLGLHRKV